MKIRTSASKTSRVLDAICYLSKKKQDDEDIFGNSISVYPTFPYNPASKTAPQTAQHWVQGWHRYGEKVENVKPVELKNYEFNITIMNIEKRSEGGRAYKVHDDEMRMFDLREDQVTEAMRHCGISPGGKINGKFTWGILNGSVKLVLVGGTSHAEMLKNVEEMKKREELLKSGNALTPDKLKFGHIYVQKHGSLHLFIGKVKLPGAKAPSYATIELPEKPVFWDGFDIDNEEKMTSTYGKEYVNEQLAMRDIAAKWDGMSWTERCRWQWVEHPNYTYMKYAASVPEGYYNRYAEISVLSSPKFESEHGDVELELAESVKKNADGEHRYVNGNRHDFAEEAWARAHNGGHRRDSYMSNRWRFSGEELVRQELKFNTEYKNGIRAAREEFRDKLSWL